MYLTSDNAKSTIDERKNCLKLDGFFCYHKKAIACWWPKTRVNLYFFGETAHSTDLTVLNKTTE